MRASWLWLGALFFLAMPSAAWATAGESECSVAGGLAVGYEPAKAGAGTPVLVALDGQWLHHASDFWAFGGALRARPALFSGYMAAATADARWTLDALTWIPSLAVGAGPQVLAVQTSSSVGLVARAEASVAYRSSRDHGWVLRAAFEGGRLDRVAGLLVVSVGYIDYHGHGIGLDL